MRRAFLSLLLLGCSRPHPHNGPAVTWSTTGRANARAIVMTQGLVTKESGPKESVQAFGESYAFVPSALAVRRDEPTQVTFWNLQADDEHDFMLMDDRNPIVMQSKLPPLKKVTFIFTFHREGLFPFFCTMHQPEMAGQVLVLPALR